MAVRERGKTLDDLHALEARPENAGRLFELIDGEIVEKMASFEPSEIAMNLGTDLNLYVRQHKLGRVTGEAGGYIMNAEGNVFIPDVAFISRERMPEVPRREAPVPPDLAVEIKSPTDRVRDLRAKAERYIGFGTRLVWLVFPEERTVEVYAGQDDVRVLTVADMLDGGDVLPGFTLPVAALFPTETTGQTAP